MSEWFLKNPVDPERVEAFSRQLGCWSQTGRHRAHLRCGRHRVYLELHGCPVAVTAADLATSMIQAALDDRDSHLASDASSISEPLRDRAAG